MWEVSPWRGHGELEGVQEGFVERYEGGGGLDGGQNALVVQSTCVSSALFHCQRARGLTLANVLEDELEWCVPSLLPRCDSAFDGRDEVRDTLGRNYCVRYERGVRVKVRGCFLEGGEARDEATEGGGARRGDPQGESTYIQRLAGRGVNV